MTNAPMKSSIYEVNGLGFSYPTDRDRKVFSGINLTLHAGEILSVLGPNGAGKSTLLDCMMGLLKPAEGSISLCGNPLTEMNEREVAKLVAYVPQTHTPTFDYTVFDYVVMGRAPHIGYFSGPSKEDRQLAEEALQSMSIEHLANKSYIRISGGERQQATIARAIAQRPKAILFDEPTAHLDYGNQHTALRLIREMAERGYGVIVTTHNPDHVLLLGGRAAILNRSGSLKCGDASDIINEENLRAVYNTDVRILELPEVDRKVCLPPKL